MLFLSSVLAFAESELEVGETSNLLLETSFIELSSKCKISKHSGTASIGVLYSGEGHNPIEIGDIVNETKIIFMANHSSIELLCDNSLIFKEPLINSEI